MKTFTASRVSDGNGVFPCKIIVGGNKITVRIPGLFSNQDKEIGFDKISEVSVDTPLVGYSTITFYTTGIGYVKAHGFTKSEVKEIKRLIEGGEEESKPYKSVYSEPEEEVEEEPIHRKTIAEELKEENKRWNEIMEDARKEDALKKNIETDEANLLRSKLAMQTQVEKEKKRLNAILKIKQEYAEQMKGIVQEKDDLTRMNAAFKAEQELLEQLEELVRTDDEIDEFKTKKAEHKEHQELLENMNRSAHVPSNKESISIKKSPISISKKKVVLQNILVELTWEKAITKDKETDCDLSVFMLGEDGKLPASEFLVFFNNLKSPDSAAKHSGEKNSNDLNQESLRINLSQVDERVEFLYIAVTINEAESHQYHFGLTQNASVKVRNTDDNMILHECHLTKSFDKIDSVLVASISRNNGNWVVEGVGQGFEGGLSALIELYQ